MCMVCSIFVCIMDWALCTVCQQKTQEALKCPLNAWGQGDKSKPYEAFLTSMSGFRELNQVPVSLNFGEEMDIDQLVAHQAKWHKSCRLKFNDNKLQRVWKREHDGSTDNSAVA